jgi:hypothetical protein
MLIASLLGLAIPHACVAQNLNGRPGQWVEVRALTLNGAPVPGPLITSNGLSPEQKSAVRLAMSKLGMPENWTPRLACLTKESFDVQAAVARAVLDCPKPTVKTQGSKARFSAKCQRDDTVATLTGDIEVIGGTEFRQTYVTQAKLQGVKVRSETRTISKWVGPDCSVPPEGISTEWLDTLNRAD